MVVQRLDAQRAILRARRNHQRPRRGVLGVPERWQGAILVSLSVEDGLELAQLPDDVPNEVVALFRDGPRGDYVDHTHDSTS